jgi:hypothetical protein
MKIPLTLIAIIALVLGSIYLFGDGPDPEMVKPRTDLPWQITLQPDGGSHVFDLDLGKATLADAQAKFGPVESYAVFEHDAEHSDLEAYFGNVMFGPLKAKVVAKLQSDEPERRHLMAESGGRKPSPSGDWKYPLAHVGDLFNDRHITAITYIPGTRGLDETFFLERFGKPAATLQENENAVSWFYPEKGLSVLIDKEGREVLEYVAPRDFVMPDGVTPYQ